MIIVRPARPDDIENLISLAKAAYPGMTTLPVDYDVLSKKIDSSTRSTKKNVVSSGDENYLLLMEDTETRTLIGTAGIFAKLGEQDQFYSYKLNKSTQSCKPLERKLGLETLHLTNHFEGFSEVATLFLDKAYRINGNGKLLARSRYLYMAQFRERFPQQVMADLRGYFDEHGNSPFWEALGRKFFGISYAEADLFGAVNGNQFIADLMPKHPIYVNMLPKAAQEVIGKPNDQGRAALAMLEKEGFRWNGHIDIFDGAPSVDAYIDQLDTVKNSVSTTLAGSLSENNMDIKKYMICSGDAANFKACVTEAKLQKSGELMLQDKTIRALYLSVGDTVRYLKI